MTLKEIVYRLFERFQDLRVEHAFSHAKSVSRIKNQLQHAVMVLNQIIEHDALVARIHQLGEHGLACGTLFGVEFDSKARESTSRPFRLHGA